MESTCTDLSYKDTGAFSSLVIDYIGANAALRPFYQHPVTWEGIEDSMLARKGFEVDRTMLVEQLRVQYALTGIHPKTEAQFRRLGQSNCFTVCTAHQPAIFTGTLYFIYKIVHAIRLADELNQRFPENHFIPVFYMGSEDADLDELGHIYLSGDTLTWNTSQQGAVGRMNVKGLEPIINRIDGELSVLPFGKELVQLIRKSYAAGSTIQQATFTLLNELFADRGLVVLIPDYAAYKKTMQPVFEADLLEQTPSAIVRKTIEALGEKYKVQANPREVNLFYLQDQSRNRIEKSGENEWLVVNTDIRFNKETLLHELEAFPERFSPNVILRGLLQETILPNIAFIGGGGELAYWLELKDLFNHFRVPYPVLILRNSFLLVEPKWKQKLDKLHLDIAASFRPEEELLNEIVVRESSNLLSLEHQIAEAKNYYRQLRGIAAGVDKSLESHVAALEVKAIRLIQELEKKLLRAEKRKFEAEKRQVHAVKSALFPKNNLQERVENFMPYYSRYGKPFLDLIYEHSSAIEAKFRVIKLQEVEMLTGA